MNGRHYLFVLWDGGGTLPPELGIARRLIGRGHRVTILSEATVEPEAQAAGCGFVEFRHGVSRRSRRGEDDPVSDFSYSSPLRALGAVRDVLVCGRAVDYSRDVQEEAVAGDYDAVVVDAFLLGALPGARATGLPVAALWAGPEMRPVPGRPPAGMGLKPSRNPLAALRDQLVTSIFRRIFAPGGQAVNEARAERGMPPLRHPFQQWDEVDRHLLLTSAAFDFPGDGLRKGVVYVGAQLDDPSWAEPWDPAAVRPGDDGRPAGADAAETPLVLVTLGSTYQAQERCFQEAMDAFRELDARGLVTLGNVFAPEAFDPPPNVQVVRSAPHNQVLPHAAAAVVHGGHGTVMKTLAAGRPMVVVPLGRDQFDNAARVEVAGAGIMVRKQTSRAVRAALREVLDDPAYGRAAKELGATLRKEFEENRAVAELEALARVGGARTADRNGLRRTAGRSGRNSLTGSDPLPTL